MNCILYIVYFIWYILQESISDIGEDDTPYLFGFSSTEYESSHTATEEDSGSDESTECNVLE